MEIDQSHMENLLYLMRRLRKPKTGCPWDIKQTFATIVPYTLEEVYEVVDTIERKDYPHLKEELGDLLFQVVFYGQLAKEQSLFSFEDIVSSLVQKLVLRHPHVFPEGTLESEQDSSQSSSLANGEPGIKQKWEEIKNLSARIKATTLFWPMFPPVFLLSLALKNYKKEQQIMALIGLLLMVCLRS